MPATMTKDAKVSALQELGLELCGCASKKSMRIYEKGAEISGPIVNKDVVSLEFWFADNNPVKGETAGLKYACLTIPGKTYRLELDIFHGYENDKYPNRIVQKVLIDNVPVDIQDISGSTFSGWRKVVRTITPKTQRVEICVMLEVLSDLESWSWGYAAKTTIRPINFAPLS